MSGEDAERVRGEEVRFEASDGRILVGTWFGGSEASQRTIVLVPAIAAPCVYLRSVACWLADQGFGVLSFDYRGVGDSRQSDADEAATMDDWALLDLPAAVAEARRRCSAGFLTVMAHSVGGQLFGMSPVHDQVDGALLIASQRGIPRLFRGWARARILYAYAVMPLLYRLLGRLPPSRLAFPVPCPGAAVSQWVRWGKTGVFTDVAGNNIEGRFAQFKGPLISVTIADDPHYATPESVAALNLLFTGTTVRSASLDPAEHGRPIGHFGWSSARAEASVRSQIADWLRELERGAS